jgi:hypothetical protein
MKVLPLFLALIFAMPQYGFAEAPNADADEIHDPIETDVEADLDDDGMNDAAFSSMGMGGWSSSGRLSGGLIDFNPRLSIGEFAPGGAFEITEEDNAYHKALKAAQANDATCVVENPDVNYIDSKSEEDEYTAFYNCTCYGKYKVADELTMRLSIAKMNEKMLVSKSALADIGNLNPRTYNKPSIGTPSLNSPVGPATSVLGFGGDDNVLMSKMGLLAATDKLYSLCKAKGKDAAISSTIVTDNWIVYGSNVKDMWDKLREKKSAFLADNEIHPESEAAKELLNLEQKMKRYQGTKDALPLDENGFPIDEKIGNFDYTKAPEFAFPDITSSFTKAYDPVSGERKDPNVPNDADMTDAQRSYDKWMKQKVAAKTEFEARGTKRTELDALLEGSPGVAAVEPKVETKIGGDGVIAKYEEHEISDKDKREEVNAKIKEYNAAHSAVVSKMKPATMGAYAEYHSYLSDEKGKVKKEKEAILAGLKKEKDKRVAEQCKDHEEGTSEHTACKDKVYEEVDAQVAGVVDDTETVGDEVAATDPDNKDDSSKDLPPEKLAKLDELDANQNAVPDQFEFIPQNGEIMRHRPEGVAMDDRQDDEIPDSCMHIIGKKAKNPDFQVRYPVQRYISRDDITDPLSCEGGDTDAQTPGPGVASSDFYSNTGRGYNEPKLCSHLVAEYCPAYYDAYIGCGKQFQNMDGISNLDWTEEEKNPDYFVREVCPKLSEVVTHSKYGIKAQVRAVQDENSGMSDDDALRVLQNNMCDQQGNISKSGVQGDPQFYAWIGEKHEEYAAILCDDDLTAEDYVWSTAAKKCTNKCKSDVLKTADNQKLMNIVAPFLSESFAPDTFRFTLAESTEQQGYSQGKKGGLKSCIRRIYTSYVKMTDPDGILYEAGQKGKDDAYATLDTLEVAHCESYYSMAQFGTGGWGWDPTDRERVSLDGMFTCKREYPWTVDYNSCKAIVTAYDAAAASEKVGALGMQVHSTMKNDEIQSDTIEKQAKGEGQTAAMDALQKTAEYKAKQESVKAIFYGAQVATFSGFLLGYTTPNSTPGDCGGKDAGGNPEKGGNANSYWCGRALSVYMDLNPGLKTQFFQNQGVKRQFYKYLIEVSGKATLALIMRHNFKKQAKAVSEIKDKFVLPKYPDKAPRIQMSYCQYNPTASQCQDRGERVNNGNGYQFQGFNGVGNQGGDYNATADMNEGLDLDKNNALSAKEKQALKDLSNIMGEGGGGEYSNDFKAPGAASVSAGSSGGSAVSAGGASSSGGGGGGGGAGGGINTAGKSNSAIRKGNVKFGGAGAAFKGYGGKVSRLGKGGKGGKKNPFANLFGSKNDGRRVASGSNKGILPKSSSIFDKISKRYVKVKDDQRIYDYSKKKEK